MRGAVDRLSEIFLGSEIDPRGNFARTITWLALAGLFSAGLVHWLVFFRFGDFALSGFDWSKEVYYYSVIGESISSQAIPFFANSPTPDMVPPDVDPRFFALPETVISPQVLLLKVMDIGNFVLANTLIMYSVGFLGCLFLRWHFRLSLLPFTFLFLVFNFNGHITSHLSVGHTMWLGYFLLPWFFLLLFELIRGHEGFRTGIAASISIVLFLVILQGSFHIFVWCLIFLGLFGLFNVSHLKTVAAATVAGIVLSAFRLVPAAMALTDWKPSYASGFPTLNTFFDALTYINKDKFAHPITQTFDRSYDVGWWEHDFFIGFLGLGLIAFFGVYLRFQQDTGTGGQGFKQFDWPLLIFVLFSFGVLFDLISDARIPLLSWMERTPARFFIMPLLGLTFISAIRMQHFIANIENIKRNWIFMLVSAAIFVELAHQLAVHSWFWRVEESEAAIALMQIGINQTGQSDSLYTIGVKIGGIVTLAFLISLTGFALLSYSRRRNTSATNSA